MIAALHSLLANLRPLRDMATIAEGEGRLARYVSYRVTACALCVVKGGSVATRQTLLELERRSHHRTTGALIAVVVMVVLYGVSL